MFIEIKTEKGTQLIINTFNIMTIYKIKKGNACIELIDGICHELDCDYEQMRAKLSCIGELR